MFHVIPSPTRAPGYAIKYTGNAKPSWTPTGVFGWYRRKKDAQARADVLNHAETPAAPQSIVNAARALLNRLDAITTDEFACGGERPEREALRAALQAIA